jgi:hypothetical protein
MPSWRALRIGPTDYLGPDRARRHYEHPARVYPVVVHERTAVRLQAAEIERFDLAVEPPVTKVALRQHREAVAGLHDDDLGAPLGLAAGGAVPGGSWSSWPGCGKWRPIAVLATLGAPP